MQAWVPPSPSPRPPSQILVRRCVGASRRARPGGCGDWLLLLACWAGTGTGPWALE